MKTLGLLVVVAVFSLETNGFHLGFKALPHIIGGQEAEPHAHPYQVMLTIKDDSMMSFCGGSLISAEWVLTAAHCVASKPNITIKATFGVHRWYAFESSGLRDAEKIIVHPDFDNHVGNDIALVKVKPLKITEGKIKPVRLPSLSQKEESFEGWPGTISGWGKTSHGDNMALGLRWMTSFVLPNENCTRQYESICTFVFDSSFICVSGAGGKGLCDGDSGGPMVIREKDGNYTLIGVSSFGPPGDCQTTLPSGFIRVTHYLDWICEHTGIKSRI